MTKFRILDCETDGLLDSVSKIHVVSYTDDGETYHSTADHQRIEEILNEPEVMLVGHNIVGYDMQVFNKLLGLQLTYTKFIDTLGLSWFLYPERNKHGLKYWGEDLGVSKPFVEDWKDVTYEQMRHRCEEDCRINWLLWEKCRGRLNEIYS